MMALSLSLSLSRLKVAICHCEGIIAMLQKGSQSRASISGSFWLGTRAFPEPDDIAKNSFVNVATVSQCDIDSEIVKSSVSSSRLLVARSDLIDHRSLARKIVVFTMT
jgi:hypothetical protein